MLSTFKFWMVNYKQQGKYSEVNRLWVDLKEQDADTQKLYKVAAEKCKKLELEAGEAKH